MTPAPLLVAAGLLAQGALLVPVAGAGPAAGLLLAGGAVLAGAAAALAWPRLAPPARASLAMLAAGGSGMTLGWWADLGFASAAAAGPETAAWCGLAPGGGAPGLHLWCWMNAGMLAAGALAMRLVHGRRAAGAIAVDGIAMALGMSAGAALAARWARGLPAEAAVVSAHAAMNAGMLAGMQLAALARIARRRRPLARGAATALPAPL